MTDAEELVRAALLDPDLDRGADAPQEATTLLAGVLARQRTLRRRRQHLATIGAAAAAVAVLGGVAVGVAAGAAPARVAPAHQPDLVTVPVPTTTAPPVEPAPSPAPFTTVVPTPPVPGPYSTTWVPTHINGVQTFVILTGPSEPTAVVRVRPAWIW